MRNLRNNAYCFQKELEIRNLILVRNRNERDQQQDREHEEASKCQTEHEVDRNSLQNDMVQEANGLINKTDN